MKSQITTHKLADLLEETMSALRQMPDMPLSKLQSPRSQKTKKERVSLTSKKTKPDVIKKPVEHFFEVSEIKPSEPQKSDMREFAKTLSALNKEDAKSSLEELKQNELIQICNNLNVTMDSKKTKESLINNILWNVFVAKEDLERIRTFEDKS